MKIPGIYVEIRGDFTKLEADMRQANAKVKAMAGEMSDSLNNVLQPDQVQSGMMGLIRNMNNLERASKLAGDVFDRVDTKAAALAKSAGLSEAEFKKLSAAMLQNRSAQATETALRKLEKQLGSTSIEYKKLAAAVANMNISFKGDINSPFAKLENNMKRAMAGIKVQSEGMSNAMKNVLLPKEIENDTMALARALGQLNRDSQLTGNEFNKLNGDFKTLARIAGMTEQEFKQLHQTMMKNKAAEATEKALKDVENQLGATSAKYQQLAAKFKTVDLSGNKYDALSADLVQLRNNFKMTESTAQKLQSRMAQTASSQATENALRNIQQQAGLTRAEMAKLRVELGIKGAVGGSFIGETFGAIRNFMGFAGIALSIGTATYALKEFYGELYKAGLLLANTKATFGTVFGKMSAKEMGYVAKEAKDLGLELTSLERAFMKLSAATKGTTMEGQKTRDIFKAVNAAGAALRLEPERMGMVFLAIEQMISKGKISTEELRRQLGEHIPGAFRDMAQAIGVTTAQLDEMLRKGKIMSEDAVPKLAALWMEKYGTAAVDASDKAQAATNRLTNAWTNFKREIASSGFMDEMVQAVNDLAAALKDPAIISAMSSIANMAGQMASNLMSASAAAVKFAGDMLSMAESMKGMGDVRIWAALAGLKRLSESMQPQNKVRVEFKPGEIADAIAKLPPSHNLKKSYDFMADTEFAKVGRGIESFDKLENTFEDFADTIITASEAYKVPIGLIDSIIKRESSYNKYAESNKGAVGLMQVLPSTAGFTREELMDPTTNIMAGVKYLSEQINKLGSVELGVASYLTGPGNMQKYKGQIPPYAQEYVDDVRKESSGGFADMERMLKGQADAEKEILSDMIAFQKKSHGDLYEYRVQKAEDELKLMEKQGATEEQLARARATKMNLIDKEMADEKEKINKEASDKINKASMERFEYEKWHLKQELIEFKNKNWSKTQLAEYESARLKEIAKDEAEAAEKAAKKSSGAASRGAASAARAENDRLKVLNKLHGETTKLTESEYKYKMLMLQQYADEIRKKYGDDKEIMDALAEYVKAKTEEIKGGFSLRGFTKDIGKAMKDMANDFGDSLSDMVVDGESSFDDIYKSFAKMIIKMAWQKLVIDNLFGGSGLLSGLFGSSTAATAAARGAAFDSGGHHVPNSQFAARGAYFAGDRAQFFGRGGIVSEMTPFAFRDGGAFRPGIMGEDGDEAIVPLGNVGGKLGVHAKGLGGKTEVKVIINNNAPDTKATASQDDQGNVTVMIEQVESALAGRMKRGTGLAGTLDARYMKRR
jgi:tape measure domain-containing protein